MVILLSGLLQQSRADEYMKTIREVAMLYFPNNKTFRDDYIFREEEAAEVFRNYAGTPQVPEEVINGLKNLCILRYPFSMTSRTMEMQAQLASYQFLQRNDWAVDLPDDAKDKILAVGEMMLGLDYEQRHQWAVAEALAFKRLGKISFEKSAAQKKWPNSYQSQLIEVLSIRPGTALPQRQLRVNFGRR